MNTEEDYKGKSKAKGLVRAIAGALLINIPGFIVLAESLYWDGLRKEAAQIADVNKDGITDAREWDSVYNELSSRHYIPQRMAEGRSLRGPQLEEYIAHHSK